MLKIMIYYMILLMEKFIIITGVNVIKVLLRLILVKRSRVVYYLGNAVRVLYVRLNKKGVPPFETPVRKRGGTTLSVPFVRKRGGITLSVSFVRKREGHNSFSILCKKEREGINIF